MFESTALQAIFARVEAGKRLRRQELQTLMTAARSGQIAIATGDRAVAIGGSADSAVIMTGDRNFVITGSDAETIRELMGKRPRTETLLLEEVKNEVTGRLERSLHNALLIDLGIESQPEQIKCPWDRDIKFKTKLSRAIDDTTTVVEVFDWKEIAGKLLILGAPGSGKTTTMLNLAQALITRAEQQPDYPMPVLFDLSLWKDDKQSLREWVVAELKSKYGVKADIGRNWLNERRLLLILDGLDEMKPERQKPCIQAINELLSGENSPLYLVVCSRTEEYKNNQTELELNGAYSIKPLTRTKIRDYLVALNNAELWEAIKSAPALLDLVKTPFLLSATIFAYQEIAIKDWQKLNSTKARLQYLLNSYVKQMLKREIKNLYYKKEKCPTPSQTQIWLIWLAQQLQRESKTDFLIEKIQPYWLSTSTQRTLYRFSVMAFGGLIVGLITDLFIIRGIFPLFVALSSWPIFGLREEIETVETLKWSGEKAKDGLVYGLRVGLILALILGLIGALINSFVSGLSDGLIDGISDGLIALLVSALLGIMYYGLKGPDLEKRTIANQGITQSAINAFTLGLILSLIWGLIGLLINRLNPLLLFGPLFLSLNSGGIACVQHFILRLILYFNGYISFDYARFLNYASERMFLQRVGGRYRFIHRLLQEHFAAMSLERVGSRE